MSRRADVKPCDLTPRQLQVVLLLGPGKKTYKAAAREMKNQNLQRLGERAPSISWRTVEQHAREVRDLVGLDLPPMRAVVEIEIARADTNNGLATNRFSDLFLDCRTTTLNGHLICASSK